jgi:hypothetical protein
MATTNGTPDSVPPDKRPRGGYSAPPPEESPRKDATADPSKEYVASSGYGAGLRDYLRALPVYVDDLTREVDLHVYERMRWDECVAGSLDALVYQALADDIDFRPAVDDEDSQYYDDSKAQADTLNRVMADMDRPLIEWAYEMVSDAIGGGNRVSEKVVRQEEGGPYSGLWVWDRLKVKPRRHLSFAMDTFNNLRGILTAIPGTYMGLDGSIPVDPKETPNLLPREKFAVLSWNSHNDDPRGRPLLRRVYVPWWEKIQVAGEWLKHLARFGSPSVVGTTAPNSDFVPPQDEFGNPLSGTSPGPEQALLNGLERLQNGGCLVLPYGATVTALQVAQSGSAFLTKVDQCDRAISRGILLAIRAVMEAQHGSKADSQTAQDVTGLVVRYVKNWTARMITRDLVRPLVVWNKGADAARAICPYASLTPVEHQDWSQKATAVAALKTSGFLKPSQEPALAEEMGLPPATEPVEQPQPPQGQQPGQNGAQGQRADTAQTPNGAEAPFAGPPDEERDESGKWTAGGSASSADPAANRPSRPEERHQDAKPVALPWKDPPPKKPRTKGEKVERPKGDQSQTKLGDHTEELSRALGFRNILPAGKRSNKSVKAEGSSIDVEFDHSGRAYEIKMCKTTSTEYRLKAKKKEKNAKIRYAELHQLEPYTMVAVRDVEKNEAHFYAAKEPGMIGAEVNPKDYDYVGSVKF